jgi:hypothetical protein
MTDEKLYKKGIWYSRIGMIIACINGIILDSGIWFIFALMFLIVMSFNHLGLWLLKESKNDSEGSEN